MNYKARRITGKGRGKLLGYPTINFEIPQGFDNGEGIYAGWVWIGKKKYKGAFHYGAVPTYKEKEKSLEVFLLDADESELRNLQNVTITIELIKKIRDILTFSNSRNLSLQISKDVNRVNKIL